MKKIVLGVAILGIYVIYSFGIRHQNPILSKPSSLSNNNNGGAPASSPSGNGSGNSTANTTASYKDGTYTGAVEDAYYGSVQVQVVIANGKITDVKFLQYPNTHSTSVFINQQAMPYLKQEALQAQSANVQIISGATFTSQAFIQSMQNALSQA